MKNKVSCLAAHILIGLLWSISTFAAEERAYWLEAPTASNCRSALSGASLTECYQKQGLTGAARQACETEFRARHVCGCYLIGNGISPNSTPDYERCSASAEKIRGAIKLAVGRTAESWIGKPGPVFSETDYFVIKLTDTYGDDSVKKRVESHYGTDGRALARQLLHEGSSWDSAYRELIKVMVAAAASPATKLPLASRLLPRKNPERLLVDAVVKQTQTKAVLDPLLDSVFNEHREFKKEEALRLALYQLVESNRAQQAQ